MRWLLGILVVLLGLGLVADIVARQIAEDRAAIELQSTFDLSERPSVSLGGFPFLLQIINGELPSVKIEASNVTGDQVEVARVNLEVRDVTFDWEALGGGDTSSLESKGGNGSAHLDDEAVTEAIREQDIRARVEFRGDQVVVISQRFGEATGELSVRGTRLIVEGRGFDRLVIALPRLGGSVAYRSASVRGSRAVLQVEIEPGPLRLSSRSSLALATAHS